jgi:hypothetical protein
MEDVLRFVEHFHVPIWLYLAMVLLLLVGLFLTVLATRIQVFEGICDLERVVDSFGEQPPTDEEFLDDRLADLVVATNRNSIQNDKIARCLRVASYALMLAVLMQLTIFTLASIDSRR